MLKMSYRAREQAAFGRGFALSVTVPEKRIVVKKQRAMAARAHGDLGAVRVVVPDMLDAQLALR
jgi:hypothetical protein